MEPEEKTWKVKISVQSIVKSKWQLWKVANQCVQALRAVESGIPGTQYDANKAAPECYDGMFQMNSSDTFVSLLEAGIDDKLVAPNRQYATTGDGFHERTVCIRVARGQDGSYGASVKRLKYSSLPSLLQKL